MISMQNVCKSFGKVRALHDVSLDIERGEFFSLLGASGSGKTTLLRMIAGFEPMTSGEIMIDGQPMGDVPPHKRPINMVFQNYAIFPHLNVQDNIAYGLRKLGLTGAKRTEMVNEMLDLIALPGYGDRRSTQLSGGQMQRVALARALILKPKVLLLDEPLGALDKQLREQMQLELRSLQQKLGITFVLVTHDQEEALTLSDRIAVMSDGEVIQVDTPSGLYDRPRSRAIASFIGNMNFFDAIVHKSTDGVTAEVASLGRIAVDAPAPHHANGDHGVIAIRPEGFEIHINDQGKGDIPAQVETRQYLGGRLMMFLRLPGDTDQPPVACQIERGAKGWDITEGQSVWLSWTRAVPVLLEAN